jgi:putative hydrolase of the HAD superfamily
MRAILFDFGGTLDYPRHWLDRFLAHYQAARVAISRSELDCAFDASTRTAYQNTHTLQGFGLARLIDYLVGLQIDELGQRGSGTVKDMLAGLDQGGRERLARTIAERFVAESRNGLARSRVLLSGWSERFKLGVVSNFYGNLDSILAEAGLAPLFDAVADSCRVGIFKPDPGIFRAALDQLGIGDATGDTLMVGDSLDKDCAPAKRLGLKTVWLRREGAARSANANDAPDFTIEALEELNDLQW